MSGIDLLFRTAIDFERTHQLALFVLLEETALSEYLFGVKDNKENIWEPEKQLFDLSIKDNNRNNDIYIEIKLFSVLSTKQLNKQQEFLKANSELYYIMLGTSWFEYPSIEEKIKNSGTKKKISFIGYDEVIDALNKVLVNVGHSSEAYQLTLAYRDSLQGQFTKLKESHKIKKHNKRYFYSLYWEIQKRLKTINTAIYTVNNPGGSVYILNNQDSWLTFDLDGSEGELYFELVNGTACVKFFAEVSKDERIKIRKRIRYVAEQILAPKYKVIHTGRLGKYMTAFQIEHDFTDVNKLDETANIFMDISDKLVTIRDAI